MGPSFQSMRLEQFGGMRCRYCSKLRFCKGGGASRGGTDGGGGRARGSSMGALCTRFTLVYNNDGL